MNDLDYLRIAAVVASEKSGDHRTQNGAVVVPAGYGGKVFIGMANDYPVKRWAAGEKLLPPEKYRYIEHAERRAIYESARLGYPTAGATLYAIWFACPECAKAIISSGVGSVVGSIAAREATPARWEDEVSAGEEMLRDAGVGVRWLAGWLGVKIVFDGKPLEL